MKKLLILDDDVVNGTLLEERLSSKGRKCIFVQEVNECLDLLENESFDLLLLDIVMPEMSGHDLLKLIRLKKNSFELPIIMVTAKEDKDDIILALRNGANDYLTKPINFDIAKARIKTQMNIRDLYIENVKSEKVDTIHKMVTTLNHEINNPLAIALGNLTMLREKYLESESVEFQKLIKALKALERITELVKEIDSLTTNEIEEISESNEKSLYKVR